MDAILDIFGRSRSQELLINPDVWDKTRKEKRWPLGFAGADEKTGCRYTGGSVCSGLDVLFEIT